MENITHQVTERLEYVNPETLPTHEPAIWAALILLGGAICYTPWFHRIELLSTLIHEIGHGLGGIFAGRKFNKLELHPDATGVTTTSGIGKLGLAFCFWCGYAAPPTTGLILTAVNTAGVTSHALLTLTIILTLCIIRARNPLTLLTLLTTAATTGILWWANQPLLSNSILALLSGYLLTAGWRQIREIWVRRDQTSGTEDPDQLHNITGIPVTFWLTTFKTHTIISTILTITLTGLSIQLTL